MERRGAARSTCGDRDFVVRDEPVPWATSSESALLKDSQVRDADKFATEHRACTRSFVAAAQYPISAASWAKAKTGAPPEDGVKAYGVKFSPDGASAALSVAIRRDEGPGLRPAAEGCSTRPTSLGMWPSGLGRARTEAAIAVIDGQGGASRRCTTASVTSTTYPRDWVVRPTVADATSGVLRHRERGGGRYARALRPGAEDDSATKCTKRRIGTKGGGRFRKPSTDEADACPRRIRRPRALGRGHDKERPAEGTPAR